MTAALSPRGPATPALPAPFLAFSGPRPTTPARRNLAGVGVAVLLHAALQLRDHVLGTVMGE